MSLQGIPKGFLEGFIQGLLKGCLKHSFRNPLFAVGVRDGIFCFVYFVATPPISLFIYLVDHRGG